MEEMFEVIFFVNLKCYVEMFCDWKNFFMVVNRYKWWCLSIILLNWKYWWLIDFKSNVVICNSVFY